MPDPLARVPDEFYAGDTLTWRRSWSDYPSTDWHLYYTFAPAAESTGSVIQIDSDGGGEITRNSDGSFTAVLAAASTDAITSPTDYHFTGRVTDGSAFYTVDRGRLRILANLHGMSTNVDVRSRVKKTLDQINARLEGRSVIDQDSMSIGNRAVSRMQVDELIRWKAHFSRLYAYEVRRERIARGLKTSRNVKVRFTG